PKPVRRTAGVAETVAVPVPLAWAPATILPEPAEAPVHQANDDADKIRPGDKVLLVVENDPGFAGVLYDAAREHGDKVLIASRGASGVALARDYSPSVITLDINLPDIDGWRVLSRLKNDPVNRHLPA